MAEAGKRIAGQSPEATQNEVCYRMRYGYLGCPQQFNKVIHGLTTEVFDEIKGVTEASARRF